MTNKTSPENAQTDEATEDSLPVVENVDSDPVDEIVPDDAGSDDVVRLDEGESSQEPDVDAPSESVAKPASKRAGVPAFVGGAVAAILGFGVAQYVPDGWPIARVDTGEIEARIASQADEIAELKQMFETQTSALANKVDGAELTALAQAGKQDVADVSGELDVLKANVEQLSRRLTDLEKRPISSNDASGEAVAAYERELTAMRETLAAQKSQIESVAKDAEAKIAEATSQAEELQAGATATANAALLRAGLSNINAAIEGGGTFEAALADLTKATGIEPSAQLQAAANSGVATVAELRRAFPNAARAALAVVAYEAKDKSIAERLGAFLRSQTGARSLEPRAGDDPDAILSRAEAAVGDGKLQIALTEIATLPPESQEEMADWVKSATYRLETQAAVQAYVSSISEN